MYICVLFGTKGGQSDFMANRLGSISRSMTCGPAWSRVDIFRIVNIHFPRSLATHCCHRKKADNPRYARPRVYAFSLSHAPVTSAPNRVARREHKIVRFYVRNLVISSLPRKIHLSRYVNFS